MGADDKTTSNDWDAWVPEILSSEWASGKFPDVREDFGRAFPRSEEKGGALSAKQEYAQHASMNLKDFGNR
jgi:hypothetical protein